MKSKTGLGPVFLYYDLGIRVILKTYTMNKVLITLAVFIGWSTGIHAQQQEPALVPASSDQQSLSEVQTTQQVDLNALAEENTLFFMKRYGIEGDEKKNRIHQAYHKYLTASQRQQGNQASMASAAEKAFEILKSELQQIAEKDVEPTIPL